jgi:ParB/RepB/Spo0J family partition protein
MTATVTPPSITMLATDQLVSFQNIRAADRSITELADSLSRVGVLEPLIVIPDEANDARWVIVAGNRRLAAAKKAKITVLPCIVRTDLGTDLRMIETQLAENLQRDPLTLREETLAFEKLTLAGMSAAEIGKVSGRKKTAIDTRLKFLDLPEATKVKVWDGQITLDEAEVLAGFAAEPDAVAWLEKYTGSPSFAWQKNNWKYEKDRRAKTAADRARQAAEKKALKEETAAAKAAGTPLPKKPASAPKPSWQIDSDKRKARDAAMQPVIEASSETRFPWIRDVVQRAAASTIKVDPLQRGLLQAAADTLLNTTVLDWDWDGTARAWLNLPPSPEAVDITTLTDGQLLALSALASTLLYDPLLYPNDWGNPTHGNGPIVTRQIVSFLDYPISPEEQALADGTVA